MNCKEVERLIPFYLNGELNERDTKEFLAHIKTCESCYEEMEIIYMASTGLERLESGSSIDINKEMHRILQHSEKRLKKRQIITRAGMVINTIAMIAVLITLLFQIDLWLNGDMPEASFFRSIFGQRK